MEVGEVAKIFRLINDVKSSEVMKKTGISKAAMSSMESGRRIPKVATIKKIAEVYNVELLQIMYIHEMSNSNNWDYYQTMKNALIEWFKNNECKTEMEEEISSIERFQMGRVLKAVRTIYQKSFTEVKSEAFVNVNGLETGDVTLSFDTLVILADVYKIPASKMLDVQERSVKGKWNFQKILYEVLVILEDIKLMAKLKDGED